MISKAIIRRFRNDVRFNATVRSLASMIGDKHFSKEDLRDALAAAVELDAECKEIIGYAEREGL